jgi:hypothetical protein
LSNEKGKGFYPVAGPSFGPWPRPHGFVARLLHQPRPGTRSMPGKRSWGEGGGGGWACAPPKWSPRTGGDFSAAVSGGSGDEVDFGRWREHGVDGGG